MTKKARKDRPHLIVPRSREASVAERVFVSAEDLRSIATSCRLRILGDIDLDVAAGSISKSLLLFVLSMRGLAGMTKVKQNNDWLNAVEAWAEEGTRIFGLHEPDPTAMVGVRQVPLEVKRLLGSLILQKEGLDQASIRYLILEAFGAPLNADVEDVRAAMDRFYGIIDSFAFILPLIELAASGRVVAKGRRPDLEHQHLIRDCGKVYTAVHVNVSFAFQSREREQHERHGPALEWCRGIIKAADTNAAASGYRVPELADLVIWSARSDAIAEIMRAPRKKATQTE